MRGTSHFDIIMHNTPSAYTYSVLAANFLYFSQNKALSSARLHKGALVKVFRSLASLFQFKLVSNEAIKAKEMNGT